MGADDRRTGAGDAVVAGTRVVVGGWFTNLNGSAQHNLGAVDPDHRGDPAVEGSHQSYPVIGLAADAAGVYVAGAGGGGNFAAFNPATGAQMWQGGTNGNVQAIGVTSGGFVYLGGHFQTYCGPQHGQHTCTTPIPRNKLLAVDEATGTLAAVGPGREQRARRLRPHRPRPTATCSQAATSRASACASSRGTRSSPRRRLARMKLHLEAPARGGLDSLWHRGPPELRRCSHARRG